MGKSVIIIGAGIGGLSAGCYGQMNGYSTRVFEMHDKPGGLCTAWERKGYTVDGCLHWLTGSSPGTGMYKLWEELGMIHGQRIYNPERFYRFEGLGGAAFDVFTDVSRLEKHMLEVAPEDSMWIKEVAGAIKNFTRLDLPVEKAPELYTIADGLKLAFGVLPVMRAFSKYSRMTMSEFAGHFTNPLLRQAWENVWLPNFSSLFMLITLALMHKKQAGYVLGGSMKLSRAIEKRYLALGGEINYRSRVKEIVVENDRAVGIRLQDDSDYRADYVVSATDGHSTIFEMLAGKYVDDKIRGYYDKLPIFQPLIYIGLGVSRTFNDVAESISGLVLKLDDPLTIAGTRQEFLPVRIHSFDPSLAPAGKTLVTVMIESTYDYWAKLHEDREKYREEKNKVADLVIGQIDRRFRGFRSQVEMIDIATPVTFRRYTGNWQGSYEGWQLTPDIVTLSMSKTLPGLDNFYMAGQWVMPGGGIPSGAMTGRYVVQLMCKKDGAKFRTSKP